MEFPCGQRCRCFSEFTVFLTENEPYTLLLPSEMFNVWSQSKELVEHPLVPIIYFGKTAAYFLNIPTNQLDL